MKGQLRVVVVLSVVLFTSPAFGVDTDGKFGVGASSTLSSSGVSGLGFNYWIGALKVGTILGFQYESPSEGDSIHQLDLALHGLYAIAREKRANLNVGARIFFIKLSHSEEEPTDLGIEVPIEAEFWVTEHVTISAHAGLEMFFPDQRKVIRVGAPLSAEGLGSPITFRGDGG